MHLKQPSKHKTLIVSSSMYFQPIGREGGPTAVRSIVIVFSPGCDMAFAVYYCPE